jgi:hypothetical protein
VPEASLGEEIATFCFVLATRALLRAGAACTFAGTAMLVALIDARGQA